MEAGRKGKWRKGAREEGERDGEWKG